MRRFAFLLGLILAAPAAGQTAPAEITAGLEDATLHLPVPAGYCAIDRSRPEEAKLFDAQAASLEPLSRLLGLAVECRQLDAFRSQQTQFGRYVEFMATEQDGKPLRRANAERGAYLAQLAGRTAPLDTQVVADVLKQRAQQPSVSTSVQRTGLVGRDEAAIYLGGIATYNDIAIANVSALTVAGGWALSCSFFSDKAEADTVPALLDTAKAAAQALVAANAGSDAPPSSAPVAATDTSWIIALAGAVALLALSAVRLIRRRR